MGTTRDDRLPELDEDEGFLRDAELRLSDEYEPEHEALLAERLGSELEVELAEAAAKLRPR